MLLLLVWALWLSNMTRMISKASRMWENSILATSIDVEFSYSIESHWQQCILREWRFFCRSREYLLLITNLRRLQNFSNYFPVYSELTYWKPNVHSLCQSFIEGVKIKLLTNSGSFKVLQNLLKTVYIIAHCCSFAKLCPILCNFMDCSMPGFGSLSLSLGVCSNSCPLSRWCHPTISSSFAPFSCPQSLPASWSFPVTRLFT